ncbi:MAG: hypothetical protein A2381_02910 [Bdellovibrionales bacterium RIFOXYB1_FULL_37_110]|nr:MAG: hypothetical protein A2181_03290 [Bdellovibrionales bacterium RIFOXYA1_FULL_38_20]OFZ51456.1 MAG: hypothetical protein A2417_09365 [Bdellovibrionales bacterium RIFOXYC1_FULL_37_79]OFZ57884.1 MAG: hypothetical protein A2381_02910 [Bdellovibrionales bacterium RIFOXYB1_FULL_37_110]OFZ63610.1 MAG: hypothetical protein A2577_05210 [Bdellovibrionales bacterium RIFOXYD1_FULL_36_51]
MTKNKTKKTSIFKKVAAMGPIVLLTLMVVLILIFFTSNSQFINHPYAYLISDQILDPKEVASASSANVLLIGDKMGVALAHYIPYIQDKTSKNLQSPLKIFNWCKKNESIVRTLDKIKKLKKIPPLIIYHGSADEFYENIFEIDDYQQIATNIKRFNIPYVQLILEFFPQLSKIIFKPTKINILKELKQDTRTYSDLEQQRKMEITYSLYHYHLMELIKVIRQTNAEIILLTTPLNFQVPPRRVCSNSTTTNLSNHLLKIKSYLDEGKTKVAYQQLKELSQQAFTNAQVYYLLGQASLLLGKTNEANQAFNLSTSFDCVPWRSNGVFNSIITQAALSNRLNYIDFHSLVNKSIERRVLFSDVFFPQTIFYEEISQQIILLIKQFFQI